MLSIFIIVGIITAISLYDFYSSKSWQNVTSNERNETVFDHRNKTYGAYHIRRNYDKRFLLILVGFVCGIGGIFAATSAFIKKPEEQKKSTEQVVVLTWDEPETPEIKEPEQPVEENTGSAEIAQMQEFLEPIVTSDPEPHPISIPDPGTPVGPIPNPEPGGGFTNPIFPNPGTGTTTIVDKKKNTEIIGIVDEYAEFPGGMGALRKYIADNLDITSVEGSAKIYMKFVVDTDGNISAVRVTNSKGECDGCEKAALEVVKSMPKWKPGKVNGESVNSYYNLPISITTE